MLYLTSADVAAFDITYISVPSLICQYKDQGNINVITSASLRHTNETSALSWRTVNGADLVLLDVLKNLCYEAAEIRVY